MNTNFNNEEERNEYECNEQFYGKSRESNVNLLKPVKEWNTMIVLATISNPIT